ncbi:hypothetical protein HS088_TW10G00690 [Tripterygium wilfordii]|uniref:Uncharacterized protein n=1 Tax=Tripterygium wilfordii TaxID=458696 RepID=A0A7J7D6J1_TRIWF|nr:uncharacterized protein LOC120007352 [Tripterygium wilfordii]KAF5741686.1 hypothetical protein HS088_TW10G00690 [Tripterygium wilfordii]
MSNSRERRRRIAERGSDRIALITGRVQTLPASPTLHHHAHTESSPPAFSSYDSEAIFSDQIDAGNKDGFGFQHEIGDEFENQDKPQLRKCKTGAEPKQGHFSETETRTVVQKAPNDFQKPHPIQSNHFFSSKLLNSCIVASEPTRAMCSLMIALLVVLSYVDYPLFGWNIVRSESIVASRPLYILLLMDVTIVLARVFYEKQKEHGAQEGKVAPRAHNWEGAEKLLERGLVAYQAIRGVFIDFSIYTVVVVCGLSFI